jgi:hypothetical protein
MNVNEKPHVEVSWPHQVAMSLVRNASVVTRPADGYVFREIKGPNHMVALTDITIFLYRASAIRLTGESVQDEVVAVPELSHPAWGSIRAKQNPSIGNTRLEFSVGRAGPVAITLYDVRGRRLRHWTFAGLAAGDHAVTWDGQAEHGRVARSGVVFAKVVSGDQAWTTKFVHLE